jgi:endonuclease IV
MLESILQELEENLPDIMRNYTAMDKLLTEICGEETNEYQRNCEELIEVINKLKGRDIF